MKFNILLLLILAVTTVSAQDKQPLNEAVYKAWIYTSKESISPNGKVVSYEQKNKDDLLRLLIHRGEKIDTIVNGTLSTFSPDSKYCLYTTKSKEKQPFTLMNLETDAKGEITGVNHASFLSCREAVVKIVRNAADTSEKNRKLGCVDLVFYYPHRKDSLVFRNVLNHNFSKENDFLFVLQRVDTANVLSLCNILRKEVRTINEQSDVAFSLVAFSDDLSRFAYLKRDSIDKKAVYSIPVYHTKNLKLIETIQDEKIGISKDFTISGTQKLGFSNDGEQLYFKVEEKSLNDSLKKGQNLDIWKWDSDFIPPSKSNSIKKTISHFCHYDLKKGNFVMLSGDDMPYLQFPEGEIGDLTIGFSDLEYKSDEGVEPSIRYDSYLIDMKTGKRHLVLKKKYYNPTISYDKTYIAWFNVADSSWYSMNTKTMEKRNLTKSIDDIFYNDTQDIPMHATHHGSMGWEKSGHNFLVHSKYDLWKIDASGKEQPLCLTKGEGRKSGIKYKYNKVSESDRYFDLSEAIFFTAFQNKTKKAGYAVLNSNGEFKLLLFSDNSYPKIHFSADKSSCIWRKQSFTDYPELYYSDAEFKKIQQLSVTNPQQKNYNWGTSELVEWESFHKDSLQGILCKPENFDPSKKYPMIVYFYEKRSDNLHKYNTPAPIGTVVNWSYCVSNGYLVFIPDVVFREGEPGNSSYDAIVSGVKTLTERHDFIDRDRIGINGHSWGGYQVAYLVTKTNLFKAAVSGAPVVNMISAYGGIRWGSGKSRMFQYEQTQSRIGGTLWDKPMEFIRNSPIFYIPAVNTPLLIMHNDKDGSVMWEQGIEFFMALRRLNKPAWMLNYKNEDHKLSNWDNKMDYTRKVMSFYDYYLKDAPKPSWM